jgi:Uma2 family endonuclease
MEHARIPRVAVADYLAGEQTSELRHEYVGGRVFAIAGAGKRHGRVVMNLGARLHLAAGDGPCRVFVADMKVRIEAADVFYYPDIVAGCDPSDDHELYFRSPCLVVEVLSDSTERADRGEKWRNYQLLSSLKEYVLVDSRRVHVEVYRHGEAGWDCYTLAADDVYDSACVNARIAVAEIYAGLQFSA